MAEPLLRSIRVRCSVEHAFFVFTKRLDLWWPASHRRFAESRLVLEAGVGGRFFERAEGGQEATLGEVLVWEPPERLSYSWFPGASGRPTRVDVRFVADAGETAVEIVHSEGESHLGSAWPERVQLFDRAWTHVLGAFATEAGEPADASHSDDGA